MPKIGRQQVRTVTLADDVVRMAEFLASLSDEPVKRRVERMIRKAYHRTRSALTLKEKRGY
jgi:hypothetical protein